jgi:3-oxoacyl-(acyl-carrier-protein) synthase
MPVSLEVKLFNGEQLIYNPECYDNVVVCVLTPCTTFTLTGFNSLKALSTQPAMPFDKNRDGISLVKLHPL